MVLTVLLFLLRTAGLVLTFIMPGNEGDLGARMTAQKDE